MKKLFKPYYISIILAAVYVILYSIKNYDVMLRMEVIPFIILAVVVEVLQDRKDFDHMVFSLTLAVTIFNIFIFGPITAMLSTSFAFAVGGIVDHIYIQRAYKDYLMKSVFNIAQGIICIFFVTKTADLLLLNFRNTEELWKLLIVGVVYYFSNAVFISLVITFHTGKAFADALNMKKSYLKLFYSLLLIPLLLYLYVDRGTVGLGLIILVTISMQRIPIMISRIKTQAKELITDSLTGAFNYKYFDSVLEYKIKNREKFSLIMIDLDSFKQINDLYGHIAGNIVLKAVSEMIKRQIRQDDLLCRYGGDEFCIILQSHGHTENTIKRIKKSMEKNKIPYNNQTISVTMSLGAYEYQGEKISKEDIINRADQAMYQSKQKQYA
ncbi:MAG: GGDEF domain-containing protein [Bacillota bacterium]